MKSLNSCKSINRDNFLETLELIKLESKEVAERLSSMPRNAKYTSKSSQEDISAAVSAIRDDIMLEIKGNHNSDADYFFSIIVDEAHNNSCKKANICMYTLCYTNNKTLICQSEGTNFRFCSFNSLMLKH